VTREPTRAIARPDHAEKWFFVRIMEELLASQNGYQVRFGKENPQILYALIFLEALGFSLLPFPDLYWGMS
jgi:hypothetical protein